MNIYHAMMIAEYHRQRAADELEQARRMLDEIDGVLKLLAEQGRGDDRHEPLAPWEKPADWWKG